MPYADVLDISARERVLLHIQLFVLDRPYDISGHSAHSHSGYTTHHSNQKPRPAALCYITSLIRTAYFHTAARRSEELHTSIVIY